MYAAHQSPALRQISTGSPGSCVGEVEHSLWDFPFSLAADSYALQWFASLPEQTVGSWPDLVEAFVARFHDYAVRVTAEQVNVVRPLRHESANQFVLRWLDARLLSTPAQSEARMVRDCISALGNLYPPASSSVMPVTLGNYYWL